MTRPAGDNFFDIWEKNDHVADAIIGGYFPQDDFMDLANADTSGRYLAVLPFTLTSPELGFNDLKHGMTLDFGVEMFNHETSQNVVVKRLYTDLNNQNLASDTAYGTGSFMLPEDLTREPDTLPESGTNRFAVAKYGSYVVNWAFRPNEHRRAEGFIRLPIFVPQTHLKVLRKD